MTVGPLVVAGRVHERRRKTVEVVGLDHAEVGVIAHVAAGLDVADMDGEADVACLVDSADQTRDVGDLVLSVGALWREEMEIKR